MLDYEKNISMYGKGPQNYWEIILKILRKYLKFTEKIPGKYLEYGGKVRRKRIVSRKYFFSSPPHSSLDRISLWLISKSNKPLSPDTGSYSSYYNCRSHLETATKCETDKNKLDPNV